MNPSKSASARNAAGREHGSVVRLRTLCLVPTNWFARMQTNATTATAAILSDHETAINSGWVMAMAFNVLVMQSGFAMLEVSLLTCG